VREVEFSQVKRGCKSLPVVRAERILFNKVASPTNTNKALTCGVRKEQSCQEIVTLKLKEGGRWTASAMCNETSSTDGLIQAHTEATIDALSVKARDDALPKGSDAFLPCDRHHCAQHPTCSCRPSSRFLLQLKPHLGCVQRNGAHLIE
jgi:hypothetical protein